MRFISRLINGGLAIAALLQGSSPHQIIRSCTGEGTIFLTFEDGPDPKNTPAILDVLKEFNIKAAFFFLQEKILFSKETSDIVKRAYNEGHLIGSKMPNTKDPFTDLRSLDFLYMSLLDGVYPTSVRCAPEILKKVPKIQNERFSDNRNFIMFDYDLTTTTIETESVPLSPIARLYDSQFKDMNELKGFLTEIVKGNFTFINADDCFKSQYPTYYPKEEKKKSYSRNDLPIQCNQPGHWHFIFDRIKDPLVANYFLNALLVEGIQTTFFVDKSILKKKDMQEVLNRTLIEGHLLVPVLTTSFEIYNEAVYELLQLDKYFQEHFNRVPNLLAVLEPKQITKEGREIIQQLGKAVVNWQVTFNPLDKFEEMIKEFNPKLNSPISILKHKTVSNFKDLRDKIRFLKSSGFELVNFNQCTTRDSVYKTVPSKKDQKKAEKKAKTAKEEAKKQAKLEAKANKENEKLRKKDSKDKVDEVQESKTGKKKESFFRQCFPHKQQQIKCDE